MSLEFLAQMKEDSLRRLAERAYAINEEKMHLPRMSGRGPSFADRRDFLDGLRLYVFREILMARLDESRESLEKIAIDKGRKLYLMSRTLELQKQIDEINLAIAAQYGRK
jgi:hypothetical protein